MIDRDAFLAHVGLTTAEAEETVGVALVDRLLAAARAHTERQIGFPIGDPVEHADGVPADLEQAVYMLAAHWFENREASIAGVTMTSIPFGYREIVSEHRSYTFG